jgi:hypothetical protein
MERSFKKYGKKIMANFKQLEKKICLQRLIKLLENKTNSEKNEILANDLNIKKHFKSIENNYDINNEKQKYLLRCLIALNFENIVYSSIEDNNFEYLLEEISKIDDFFSDVGGIVGYQYQVLKILTEKKVFDENISFHTPFFTDISSDTQEVKSYIRAGIEKLDQIGEIYVVGGAADRLHLIDEKSMKRLPAAMMKFYSKKLLKRLLDDVKAKEYLYEKITGKKIITPIALMCSNENDNFQYIKALFEENNYFDRPFESFFFLVQPSVPVVTKNGMWILDDQGKILLKPSGHGALWKLAKSEKLFEWFFEKKRKKALIRQINNPIAGIDYGLLAFTGYGLKNDSELGFASCPRQIHSAEGMNVLIKRKSQKYFEYCITNIEYCDFEKFKIEDKPISEKENISKFSSNTNLLFVDLGKIQKKIIERPYPGALINFKPLEIKKNRQKIIAGRLETTMQNIADVFVERHKTPLKPPFKLSKVYVTHNDRIKTISTVKRAYIQNNKYLETPEKCFYDYICNAYDLLKNYCGFKLAKVQCFEIFNHLLPPFLLSYHPALGPLYNLIAKKLQKGSLEGHSELVLEIAELNCFRLNLNGSFRIFASDLSSKCVLENVSVKNKGINYKLMKNLWKGDFSYLEKCDIFLGKNSTLIAKDLTILNEQTFVVPDNKKVEIVAENKKFVLKETDKDFKNCYYFSRNDEIEIMAEKKKSSQP